MVWLNIQLPWLQLCLCKKCSLKLQLVIFSIFPQFFNICFFSNTYSIFINTFFIGNHEDAYNKHELSEIRSKWVGNGQTLLLGDAMVLLSAVYITEKFGCTKDFCDRHGLRFKAMQEIRKLRRQLTNELTRTANLQIVLDPNSETPGIYFDFRFFYDLYPV